MGKADVLIISTNRNRLPVPVMPYGACLVAESAERAGYRINLLDLMLLKDPIKALKRELNMLKPDVVGISIRNIDNNDMKKTVAFFKELSPIFDTISQNADSITIIGGSAVGVMPEELLRYTGASFAVLGDGEIVFPELLDAISKGKDARNINGIAWIEDNMFIKNPLSYSETRLFSASPDFSKWIDLRQYKSLLAAIPIQTKRGCPYKCIYCTYAVSEGKNYRLCNPDDVVEGIKRLNLNGLMDFEFVDNVFNSPYEHAMKICEGLAKAGLNARFQSLELNPLFIDDEILKAMEMAGFVGIGITVESASDVVLSGLKKGFTTDDIYKASQYINRHKLPCLWIFMLGGPGETEDTVKETIRFAESHIRPTDAVFFNMGIRIYPGTELEYIARKQGILNIPHNEMLEPLFYISPDLDPRWLDNVIKTVMNKHLNFMNSESLSFPFLPVINRLAYRLRVRPPLWRHTSFIRRGLRLIGIDA